MPGPSELSSFPPGTFHHSRMKMKCFAKVSRKFYHLWTTRKFIFHNKILLNQNRLSHQIMEMWECSILLVILRSVDESTDLVGKMSCVLMKLVRTFRSAISCSTDAISSWSSYLQFLPVGNRRRLCLTCALQSMSDCWLQESNYWRVDEFEKFRETNDWQTNRSGHANVC